MRGTLMQTFYALSTPRRHVNHQRGAYANIFMLNTAHDRWAARHAANSDDNPDLTRNRARHAGRADSQTQSTSNAMGAGARSAEFAAAISN